MKIFVSCLLLDVVIFFGGCNVRPKTNSEIIHVAINKIIQEGIVLDSCTIKVMPGKEYFTQYAQLLNSKQYDEPRKINEIITVVEIKKLGYTKGGVILLFIKDNGRIVLIDRQK